MVQRAVVVGSGPNGLSAACRLARAGWQVSVYESGPSPGGAARSAELFGPGIISDLGASIHPLSAASPAYEELLTRHGVEWVRPTIQAAHGLDGAAPAMLHSSLEDTAKGLGRDGELWRWLIGPLAANWNEVRQAVLSPPLGKASFTQLRRVAALAQIGSAGAMPASSLMRSFRTGAARALFAGLAAHSTAPLSNPLTAAVGLAFGAAAHTHGWPVARGGSQSLVNALIGALEEAGGEVRTDAHVSGLRSLPLPSRPAGTGRRPGPRGWQVTHWGGPGAESAAEIADVVVLDLTPAQVLGLDGLHLAPRARKALRQWDYGPGVVKIDYLLEGPIPWTHQELAQAGTVHLGGSGAQVVASEAAANRGVLPGRPYVLLAQPSAADSSRTPDQRTVCWAYAHVPNGLDAAGVARTVGLIEQEISRQAPDFRDAVLDSKVWGPAELEEWNPNLVGGSVSGGVAGLRTTLSGPISTVRPYSTGVDGVYMCSSSTPPGGGAHGMNGFNAAGAVLKDFK